MLLAQAEDSDAGVWEEIENEESAASASEPEPLPTGEDWERLPSPSQSGRVPLPDPEPSEEEPKRHRFYVPSKEQKAWFPSSNEKDYSMFTEPADIRYDARNVVNIRPRFSMWVGPQWRSYANAFVDTNQFGKEVGLSYRLIDAPFGSATGLAFAGILSFHTLGTFTNASRSRALEDTKDFTFRLGPILEVGLTSRLQAHVGLLYRQNQIRADSRQSQDLETAGLKQRGFYLGFGGIYDFYKVPYARMGIRGYIQPASVVGCITFCADEGGDLASSPFDDNTAETLFLVAFNLSLGIPPKTRPQFGFEYYDY